MKPCDLVMFMSGLWYQPIIECELKCFDAEFLDSKKYKIILISENC